MGKDNLLYYEYVANEEGLARDLLMPISNLRTVVNIGRVSKGSRTVSRDDNIRLTKA